MPQTSGQVMWRTRTCFLSHPSSPSAITWGPVDPLPLPMWPVPGPLSRVQYKGVCGRRVPPGPEGSPRTPPPQGGSDDRGGGVPETPQIVPFFLPPLLSDFFGIFGIFFFYLCRGCPPTPPSWSRGGFPTLPILPLYQTLPLLLVILLALVRPTRPGPCRDRWDAFRI